MSQTVFANVPVGGVFVYNSEEFKKTDKKKISCCKFYNAVAVANPNKKIGIKDNESVEVSE